MVSFLNWAKGILVGALNGMAKIALAVILIVILFALIGLTHGDGMPGKMVLTADLRSKLADSSPDSPLGLGNRKLAIMDLVLALDRAGRDDRVKGLFIRVGDAGVSVAEAEEVGAAIQRFRKTGKFVIAHAQGFDSTGLGDYLMAASADQIWMQPQGVFSSAGSGAGAVFLRGFFDKIQATPQIAKRADYKSAADMFMEKDYTAADREQTTALLQSWYSTAAAGAAADRKLGIGAVEAAFDASPQFASDAKSKGLIDKIGFDDEAKEAAIARAGGNAKTKPLNEYAHATEQSSDFGSGAHVALVEASGEIVDGTAGNNVFDGNAVIAGDDYAQAIRQATKDKDIKAILIRVDSPGGSVSASDQILDAVKKAQAAGKPVVVSMGNLAASGGYYISCSANRIVAEPATLTGSIGVLTGKVAVGKSLGLIGVTADEIGVGKNALFDSAITPYTDDQWKALNNQADVIYGDFMHKVAAGRKLPFEKVQEIAKGRVWTGADAHQRGLVDELGNFWTAVDAVKKLAKIAPDTRVIFEHYPRPHSIFETLGAAFDSSAASIRVLQGVSILANTPAIHSVIEAVSMAPRGGVALQATGLPQ
ncbi:MAG TPA: signal peptide peptidase SppA [Rhizomicrobium sp.]|nr:signal peptide peptidase SppA [Rhizomicrobium sp.]